MKPIALLVLAALLSPLASPAANWVDFDDSHHITGPKVTAKDLDGKVVVVDMWAIWCGPCRAMMPHTQAIWEKYKSKPVIVIGSHVSGGYKEAEAKEFIKNGGFSFPFYLSARWDGKTGFDGGIPFIYVIDGKGECVYGGRRPAEIEQAIDKALSHLATAPCLVEDESALVEYKSLKGKLVLGKPVTNALRKLREDIKTAEKMPQSQTFAKRKAEAVEILKQLNARRDSLIESINRHLANGDKPAAEKEIGLLIATWPKLKAEWAPRLKELKESAKQK